MSREHEDEPSVRWDRHGDVLLVTLNRPAKRNALNAEMLVRLRALLADATRPSWARAVVLTGAGSAFAAGADIGFYREASEAAFLAFTDTANAVCDEIETAGVPVVAAVNGVALGGGFELALACDWIVAGQDASFGLPEVNLGLIPGWGGTQRLSAAVGARRAYALIADGARLSAIDARELGLVGELATAGDLITVAVERGQKLGAGPRRAILGLRRALLDTRATAGFSTERAELAAAFAHPDAREGVEAFLEKRPPRFGRGD